MSVIRTRTICPRCNNKVAVRIAEDGATIPIHRVARDSSAICR